MDTHFALLSFLMMMLMIFGVFIYYAATLTHDTKDRVLLVGVISILVGSITWIVFAYDLSYFLTFRNDRNYLELMISLLFYLYAITMLVGSVIERIQWQKIFVLIPLWTLIVYMPIANLVWGNSGFIYDINRFGTVYDFSGGLVVHLSAGIGAYVLATKIKGEKQKSSMDSMAMYIGGLFIMIGWFAFNMAPAQSLSDHAIQIWFNTFVSILVGGLSGFFVQGSIDKEYSIAGIMNGIITALVGSTVSVGYVNHTEAALIAFLVSSICPYFIKRMRNTVDTVDSFGMNAGGGFLGSLFFSIIILRNEVFIFQIAMTLVIALWSFIGAQLVWRITQLRLRRT